MPGRIRRGASVFSSFPYQSSVILLRVKVPEALGVDTVPHGVMTASYHPMEKWKNDVVLLFLFLQHSPFDV